jgi:small GTP-binding protein
MCVSNTINKHIMGNKSAFCSNSKSESEDEDKKIITSYNSVNNDSTYLCRIIIVGDSMVGKTSVCNAYTKDSDEISNQVQETFGIDFTNIILDIDDKKFKLQIWDTPGNTRFKSIVNSYYRGSMCVIVMYDITNRKSFDNVTSWIDDIDQYAQKNVVKVLVGNKYDLKGAGQVSFEDGYNLASKNNMLFLETSIRDKISIDMLFTSVCRSIYQNQSNFIEEKVMCEK